MLVQVEAGIWALPPGSHRNGAMVVQSALLRSIAFGCS
jgi:hypothetical protein